jgi:hypothetical protein
VTSPQVSNDGRVQHGVGARFLRKNHKCGVIVGVFACAMEHHSSSKIQRMTDGRKALILEGERLFCGWIL